MIENTRASLLDRLRDGDDALAWRDFFDRYWRVLYLFAVRCGGSDQIAQEVVQEAMVVVFESRDVFQYDPSRGRFRNWLYTIVRQKLALRHRREAAERRAVGVAEELKGDNAAAGPADQQLEEEFEHALLAALLEMVRREVRPETYQAFELTALHELPATEAANLTGMSPNAVYLARTRVLRRLKELGATWSDEGRLDPRLTDAMRKFPDPVVEQSLVTRVETTLKNRQRPRE